MKKVAVKPKAVPTKPVKPARVARSIVTAVKSLHKKAVEVLPHIAALHEKVIAGPPVVKDPAAAAAALEAAQFAAITIADLRAEVTKLRKALGG